jgi:outer membrane immunogenic protein
MKALIAIPAAAALLAAFTLPAVADAQDASSPTIYGNLGYSQSALEGIDLGSLQARLGARFSPHFGVEGELSAGIKNDATTVSGVELKSDLDHQVAVYGVAFLPILPNADLFVRAGYGDTKVHQSAAGSTGTVDGDSWNYGVGGQYFFNDKNGVRADYTRYDLRESSANADTWSLAYVRKF